MMQASMGGFGQTIECSPVDAGPKQLRGPLYYRRQQVLECARLALCTRKLFDTCLRALQRRLNPYCVIGPARQAGRSLAANGGESLQDLVDRPSVAAQPLGKERPIAAGTGLAP